MARSLGIAIWLATAASHAFAGAVVSPEIDASSGTAAVGLLAGGLLILRSRKKMAQTSGTVEHRADLSSKGNL